MLEELVAIVLKSIDHPIRQYWEILEDPGRVGKSLNREHENDLEIDRLGKWK